MLTNNIMCAPLTINIDMIYSVNRSFIIQFETSNELDSFSGVNFINIAILENGKPPIVRHNLTHVHLL